MLTFSQIDAVAQTIKNKVATFREDIIESNKGKVRETLEQYLQVFEEQLSSHHCFLQKIMPEFENVGLHSEMRLVNLNAVSRTVVVIAGIPCLMT